jgi:hypothetical protein
MRNDEYFRKLILASRDRASPEYGGNVMPALELFKSLQDNKEIRAFQDALESMLKDEDPCVQSFAVDLCLGFFVFRNVI